MKSLIPNDRRATWSRSIVRDLRVQLADGERWCLIHIGVLIWFA